MSKDIEVCTLNYNIKISNSCKQRSENKRWGVYDSISWGGERGLRGRNLAYDLIKVLRILDCQPDVMRY